VAIGLCFISGCKKDDKSQSHAAAQSEGQQDQKSYQRDKEEALDEADKLYEERAKHPQSNQIRLPNFETGPGRPLPNHVNFYTMDDRFPSYLLCEYAVDEVQYDASKESRWFNDALEQIRLLGPKKFPPIKRIAVAIRNVAEHKDRSTFEISFKVGALFSASDVFDASQDSSSLISLAVTNRHPFKFDPQQPTPGQQQRWLIVERDAATNHISQ